MGAYQHSTMVFWREAGALCLVLCALLSADVVWVGIQVIRVLLLVVAGELVSTRETRREGVGSE